MSVGWPLWLGPEVEAKGSSVQVLPFGVRRGLPRSRASGDVLGLGSPRSASIPAAPLPWNGPSTPGTRAVSGFP